MSDIAVSLRNAMWGADQNKLVLSVYIFDCRGKMVVDCIFAVLQGPNGDLRYRSAYGQGLFSIYRQTSLNYGKKFYIASLHEPVLIYDFNKL